MATYSPTPNAQTTVVVQPMMFGDNPSQMTCPHCQSNVVTTVTKKNGAFAWILAIVVCLLCCPCFWIPLVTDCSKDSVHTCPHCNSFLGEHKRI